MPEESVISVKPAGLEPVSIGFIQEGRGTPVIFVHGWLSCREKWTDTMEALSKTHQVIAMDLPGHGSSPPLPPHRTSIDGFTSVLSAFIENSAFQEPAAIVADSMGGVITLNLIKKQGAPSRRIILSGCPFEGIPGFLFPLKIKGITGQAITLLKKLPPAVSSLFISLGATGKTRPFNQAGKVIIDGCMKADPATAEILLREMMKPLTGLETSAFSGAKTLVTRGGKDIIVSRKSGHRLARISRGRYVEIPDCGHNIPVDQEKAFTDVVERFINDRQGI